MKQNTFSKEFLIMQRAEKAVLARDYASAVRLYVRLLKSDPNNIDVLSKLGSVYVYAGDDANAFKIYKTVIQSDPSNLSALNHLSGIYRRRGQYDESIKLIEKVRQVSANPDEMAYNEGYTYKLMGKYDEAVSCFLNAIELNPNDVLAYNHLGTIEDLLGQPDKALSAFSRGLQIDPNHPILHYNLALHFVGLNEAEKAITHFEAALRVRPNWDEALDAYSELLIKINRPGRAEEVLQQNIKLNPKSISAYNKLGKLYAGQNDFAKAENAYLKALALDGENMCALDGLGKVYDKQKKYFDAAAIMERLGKLQANDTETSLRYAKILIELERFRDADILLKKIYDASPHNIQTLNVLAQYFARRNDIKKAYTCYRRILRIDCKAADFLKDNAEQFMHTGKLKYAEQLLKEYLRRKTEDADAWARLGKCYRELGKYKKALKALSCSLNIDNNNYFAIEELGILTQFLNEDAASMNFIAELLNKNNDSDPDLDTLRSSMTVRETALDAMEKDENKNGEDVLDGNAFGGEKGEDENRDKDEDDFPVSSAEIGFESLRQKEDEGGDAVLKLDAAADEPLFHDEYDPLIFPESFFSDAENEKSFEQKDKEPFDLSNLFPVDSPLEITPTDKDELFDDFFDKKSSQHYDPIEEEELLTVDGSGFEPDDGEDGVRNEEKTIPVFENLPPPVQNASSPIAPQSPVPPQFISQPAQSIPPVPQTPVPAAQPITPPQTVPLVQNTPPQNVIPVQSAPLPLHDMPLDDVPLEPEFLPPEPQPKTESAEPVVPTTPRPEENGNFEDENPLPDEMPIDTEQPLFDEDFPVEDDRPLEVLDSAEEPEDDENFDEMLMNQVRKVLDDVFDTSPIEEFSRTFEMFNSLRGLCSYLPDEKKDEFFSDLNRVKLDYVIDRLEGKPGLLAAAQALHSSGLVKPYTGAPKKEFLQRTLSYMDSLANTLTDKGHARALRKEIHRVLDRLNKKSP